MCEGFPKKNRVHGGVRLETSHSPSVLSHLVSIPFPFAVS